jgi:hypothetical protein
MARKKSHNPERRAWKGRSYKAAGRRVNLLRDRCSCAKPQKQPGSTLCQACQGNIP